VLIYAACLYPKRNEMFKIIKLSLFSILIVATAACVTQENNGGNPYLDSTAVTKKIKTKLTDQLGAQGLSIRVKTYRDEVQLSGIVGNIMVKQKAGKIASSETGVKHVRNNLVVKR